MKGFLRIVPLLLVTIPLHGALEFSGYMKSGDAVQFVIMDVDARVTSGFLVVGSTFRGHKVIAFDPEREVLLLEREGKTIRLPLKDSRVREGSSAVPPKVELKVAITQDGTPVVNGQAITFEAFDILLRKHAESGMPLALSFHQPPDPSRAVHETIKKLHRALGQSGVKKTSIKIVDAPRPSK